MGWTEPHGPDLTGVAGQCPACGHGLYLAAGGVVTCVRQTHCARPTAAAELLALDHRHLVDLAESGWSIEHPGICRLGGRLLDCDVHTAVATSCADPDDPPARWGRYFVEATAGVLAWIEANR